MRKLNESKKQAESDKQPSSTPIIIKSILRSPVVFTMFAIGGSWLMLNTVVHSGFPGSIELLLAPNDGFQLKIDGGQALAEVNQSDGNI